MWKISTQMKTKSYKYKLYIHLYFHMVKTTFSLSFLCTLTIKQTRFATWLFLKYIVSGITITSKWALKWCCSLELRSRVLEFGGLFAIRSNHSRMQRTLTFRSLIPAVFILLFILGRPQTCHQLLLKRLVSHPQRFGCLWNCLLNVKVKALVWGELYANPGCGILLTLTSTRNRTHTHGNTQGPKWQNATKPTYLQFSWKIKRTRNRQEERNKIIWRKRECKIFAYIKRGAKRKGSK